MKAIAAIEVDLAEGPLGNRSRLADELGGRPVLLRTIDRVRDARRVDSIHIITGPSHRAAVEELVGEAGVTVEAHDAGLPPWQDRVRCSRKWAMTCWRGGVAGLCAFDEAIHTGVLAGLGRRDKADIVVSVPAAAVLLDPAILDAMIEHFEEIWSDTRLVFAQSPPGLTTYLARPDLFEEVFRTGHPPGAILTYIPGNPQLDFTTRPCCYAVPGLVVETSARVLADTRRGVELIEALLDEADERELTAERVCRIIRQRRAGHLDELPHEVEIELTTEDHLPDTSLRPRGERVPRRGPMPVETVGKLTGELGAYDDSLVMLGGFGEPLLHPDLPAVLSTLRGSDILGVAVRTNGLALEGDVLDLLIDERVDVVNVTVDAHSAATYQQLNGRDVFERVVANVRALRERIIQRDVGGPVIVPEMAKVAETLGEQEPFFDDWLRAVGWANIVSPSHYARQLPDRRLMNMAPPKRWPCRRLWSSVLVLADGRVVTCDQDYAARQGVGDLNAATLSSIWRGEAMGRYRRAHETGELTGLPLCAECEEWHRPA